MLLAVFLFGEFHFSSPSEQLSPSRLRRDACFEGMSVAATKSEKNDSFHLTSFTFAAVTKPQRGTGNTRAAVCACTEHTQKAGTVLSDSTKSWCQVWLMIFFLTSSTRLQWLCPVYLTYKLIEFQSSVRVHAPQSYKDRGLKEQQHLLWNLEQHGR